MSLEKPISYFSQNEQQEKAKKKCTRYCYKIFGLHITSDILLPDFLTVMYEPDISEVNIRLGKVPNSIVDANEKNENYEAAKNQFLLQIPEVGNYYVTNGNDILIEPAEEAEDRFVRIFLLGTVFSTLLAQRGILAIHGSAVVINGCGIVFTGESGAGKSTLLAAFRERGYPYLTDDVAAISVDKDGIAWVHPAYPQQKLWRDSAEAMGLDITDLKPIYVYADKDKFAVAAHKGFWPAAVPLTAVYKLETENSKEVILQHLVSMDKLVVLMKHTYRCELFEGLGLKAAHFKQCAAVAKQVDVCRLIRPEGIFSMAAQINLVENDLARDYNEKVI